MKQHTLFLLVLLINCSSPVPKPTGFDEVNPSEYVKTMHGAEIQDDAFTYITFNEIEEGQELLLSEVIDTMWYILLDNSNQALLGDIDKILFVDNHMYILDKHKTKALKVFSINGGFIRNIGNQGKGPGEYVEPTDFILLNEKIIIYDQFTSKLIYYNNHGQMLKEVKVPFIFNTFHAFSDNEFVFQFFDCDNNHFPQILGYSLVWCDSLFNISHRGIYQEYAKYVPMMNRGLIESNGQLFFSKPFSDTIYQVDRAGTLKANYVIDFKRNRMTELPIINRHRSRKGFNFASLGDFALLKDEMVYFTFTKEHSLFHCFYANTSESLKFFNTQLNDVAPLNTFENIISSMDNILIGYNTSFSIHELYNMISKNGHTELLNQFNDFKGIKSNDNLVLTFYRLKEL